MYRGYGTSDWFIVLLLAVAWYCWAVAKRLLEWLRQQSWPVVQGKVATPYVQMEMNRGEERKAEICYSYDVDGHHYFGVADAYEADFGAYPPGSPILVHYKPSDPSVSRLDRRDMREREHALDTIDEDTLES